MLSIELKGTIDKPADGVMYTLKDIDADAVVLVSYR